MIKNLFDNGINTYKLSIKSITNNQLNNLLNKLLENKKNDNIEIILLKRKNVIDKILSKCYSVEYRLKNNNFQGFDVIKEKSEVTVSKKTILNCINEHIIFEERYNKVKNLLKVDYELIYEDFYYDKFYFYNMLSSYNSVCFECIKTLL
jgi:hypothetical protein